MLWSILAYIAIGLIILQIGFHLGYETARRDAHRDLYNALAKFDFKNNGHEISEDDIYGTNGERKEVHN